MKKILTLIGKKKEIKFAKTAAKRAQSKKELRFGGAHGH